MWYDGKKQVNWAVDQCVPMSGEGMQTVETGLHVGELGHRHGRKYCCGLDWQFGASPPFRQNRGMY